MRLGFLDDLLTPYMGLERDGNLPEFDTLLAEPTNPE